MSVIVSRALPDVRDGLKPVHRRVLYAMNELGLTPTRGRTRSRATVVGDVLGKYHPHGDSSVYDALVRMVQDFSLRYPLVDGQGNFGSVDGDPAAAYRYTEARLTRVAMEMLADIDKNTVDFAPNYDDRLQEPKVLPRASQPAGQRLSGIAVGMATNIPPHNLREVVAALHALIDDPELDRWRRCASTSRGPTSPPAPTSTASRGSRDYIETGRGRVVMRARAVIEEKESGNKSQIVVTELPYQVNKARLVEQIAELHREGKVEGISALRDESDRDGMRIVIELKRDAIPRVVLNQLYKHSTMQSDVRRDHARARARPGDGRLVPKVMPVKEVLEHFVTHRHDVIVRRTQFELDKALEREHILEGLKIAVDNIDEVIKHHPRGGRHAHGERAAAAALQAERAAGRGDPQHAPRQAHRPRDREAGGGAGEVRATIADLRDILESRAAAHADHEGRAGEIAASYGDERRSEIIADEGEFSIEDLIAEEDMVVTISHSGYIKRTPVTTYRKQRRGGRGLSGQDLKDTDFIERLFIASTHDYIMIFTDDGRCFWLKVHEIPVGGRARAASRSST
jgi:DNA gyrase subunit A